MIKQPQTHCQHTPLDCQPTAFDIIHTLPHTLLPPTLYNQHTVIYRLRGYLHQLHFHSGQLSFHIRTRDIASSLQCSQRSAHQQLIRLSQKGLIQLTKKGFGWIVRLINIVGWITRKTNKDKQEKKFDKMKIVREKVRIWGIQKVNEDLNLLKWSPEFVESACRLIKQGKDYYDWRERKLKSVTRQDISDGRLNFFCKVMGGIQRRMVHWRLRNNKIEYRASQEVIELQEKQLEDAMPGFKNSVYRVFPHVSDKVFGDIWDVVRGKVLEGKVKGVNSYLRALGRFKIKIFKKEEYWFEECRRMAISSRGETERVERERIEVSTKDKGILVRCAEQYLGERGTFKPEKPKRLGENPQEMAKYFVDLCAYNERLDKQVKEFTKKAREYEFIGG